MTGRMPGPTSHTFFSQRLRLHYVDWGNSTKPPMVMLHGGRDHCRNWDWAAEPHDVLRVLDRLVELRGVLVDDHELEAGRRQLARHVEDRVGLLGNEEDLGRHIRLLLRFDEAATPAGRSPSRRSGHRARA